MKKLKLVNFLVVLVIIALCYIVAIRTNVISVLEDIYIEDKMEFLTACLQLIYFLGFAIAMLIHFSTLKTESSTNQIWLKKTKSYFYRELSDTEVTRVDSSINPEEFEIQAFEMYKNIQTAWMNFDTNTIKDLTTNELYSMYLTQLETLELKGQKNIINEIDLEESKIIGIKNEKKVYSIAVYLRVNCYDYLIDSKTKRILRGKKYKKMVCEYLITYVKNSNKEIKNCPNCGTQIKADISSHKCPYCDSLIVLVPQKYVMNNIRCIGQHMKERK